MHKYFPNRSEAAMLLVGLALGTMLSAWLKIWMILLMIAPIILVVEVVIYAINKQRQDFKQQLAHAKDAEALLGKKKIHE